MLRPERCVGVIVATAILHNIFIDRRLPAPEIDDAASDIDGDEGVTRAMIVNRITRNDAVIARDNLMRAVFPLVNVHSIIVRIRNARFRFTINLYDVVIYNY